MASHTHGETAKIYAFPKRDCVTGTFETALTARNRFAGTFAPAPSSVVAFSSSRPVVDVGGWYHGAAIEDAQR